MRYYDIHEEAIYFDTNRQLVNPSDEHLLLLTKYCINYLAYAVINHDYTIIYKLTEYCYQQCHKREINVANIANIPLETGTYKVISSAIKYVNQINKQLLPMDQQIFISGLISIDRVKHSASQWGVDDLSSLQLDNYEEFFKKFKSKVPYPIVAKTIKLSIARMNRFSVIHDYLVEKFTIKYSARIPRFDDYCKLLEALKKKTTPESLDTYLARFDTAKFTRVSVYSPWDVCYYHELRNALSSLPVKVLASQFDAYVIQIKKIDSKKISEPELEVLRDVKQSLKVR